MSTGYVVAYDGKRRRWIIERMTTEVVGEFGTHTDAQEECDRLRASTPAARGSEDA